LATLRAAWKEGTFGITVAHLAAWERASAFGALTGPLSDILSNLRSVNSRKLKSETWTQVFPSPSTTSYVVYCREY